jgi:RNA polymerase sigma-70 factor (ECF subfamily)
MPDPVNVAADETEQLVARFRRPLLSYFRRRVREPQDAEDLTQEVFLRLARCDESVRNPDIFVFRIAANLLRDRARMASTHHLADHNSLDEVDARSAAAGVWDEGLLDERQPERILLGQESLTEVVEVLGELGGRTRDIFLLFRLEAMPHRGIASLYGITVSAVEKHIAKASAHLAWRFGAK